MTAPTKPVSPAQALVSECADWGLTLRPATAGLGAALTAQRQGAVLCQPAGVPTIWYRTDLTVDQRVAHVRFLVGKVRQPWAGAFLLQDPDLMLPSPEFA